MTDPRGVQAPVFSALSHLECSRDGSRHDAEMVQGTSPLGAPLLLAAQGALARDEGAWVCPEGAACFAAVGQLRESGWLGGADDVVVLNTGAGLIYPDTVTVDVPTLPRDGVIPGPVGR